MKTFSLVPFTPIPDHHISIQGALDIKQGKLCVEFNLQADLQQIIIPSISERPERKHDLWEHTCFEIFFKATGSRNYYEMNLSPSGDWNLYYFDDYRQGMKEEKRINDISFKVVHKLESISISVGCFIRDLCTGSTGLKIGVSAIVEHIGEAQSFWALKHPVEKPDFHYPESFVLDV